MKTTKPTLKTLAQRFRCNEKTVRRWKSEGAPLNDPKAMRDWLAGRKSLPAATRELLASEANMARAKRVMEGPPLPRGAAAALARLEESEALAYSQLQDALQSGNQLTIKLAREGFLKTSDSLRRYDLALDMHRRQIGEMVSRKTVEFALGRLAWLLRIQAQNLAPQLALKIRGMNQIDAFTVIREQWAELTLNALAELKLHEPNSGGHVPQAHISNMNCLRCIHL